VTSKMASEVVMGEVGRSAIRIHQGRELYMKK